MNKTTMALSVAAISIFAIAGCGTNASSNTTGANTTTTTNKTVAANLPPTKPASVHFVPQYMTFLNSKIGYVSGQTQGQDENKDVGYVYKTTDGGHTWHQVLRKGTDVSNVAVLGRDAWVDVTTQKNGALYFSSDGGRSFQPMNHLNLGSIDFTSKDVGWAIVHQPSFQTDFVRTNDGGRTWAKVNLKASGLTGNATWPSFADANNGWLLNTSEPGAGNQGKSLLRTVDGGQHWSVVAKVQIGSKRGPNQLRSGGYAKGIDVVPMHPSHAYLWESRGPLLSTTDGGKTWRTSPLTKPELIEARGVSMQSLNQGFVLLQDMEHRDFVLEHTTNAGANWDVVYKWPY